MSAKAYGHDVALRHELSTLRRQLQSREEEAGKLRGEVETLRTVVQGVTLLGEHLDNAGTPASQMESTWAKLSEASALMDSAGLRKLSAKNLMLRDTSRIWKLDTPPAPSPPSSEFLERVNRNVGMSPNACASMLEALESEYPGPLPAWLASPETYEMNGHTCNQ